MNHASTPATDASVRDRLIRALTDALLAHRWSLAAWLGGSDANGRTDEWSDIDLVTIVEDDHVDDAIDACKRAVVAIAPIALELRLPMPTWHGHDQVFWQLDGVPDWCMIDLVVIRRTSTASRFLEEERHGTALVLFDREGLVRPAPFDRAAHETKMRERLEALIPRFRLLQHLVRKATWRRDPTEAADRYVAYTLKPLVELLRIRHCPDRYDFGLRYLRDDLPEESWRAIEAIALPGSLEGVRKAQRQAEELFEARSDRDDAAIVSPTNPMLFTIGHSRHPVDRFIALLRMHSIELLADVRSTPLSRFSPQFNRERLAASLRAAGIEYEFLGDELGARRSEPEAYKDDRADYELIARLPAFLRGIARVQELASYTRIALMCAERDPMECHRAILVAPLLRQHGLDAQHILEGGELETSDAFDARLLGMEEAGAALFASEGRSLEDAYRNRGRDIAYRRTAGDSR